MFVFSIRATGSSSHRRKYSSRKECKENASLYSTGISVTEHRINIIQNNM
jgi:hypothetical protein